MKNFYSLISQSTLKTEFTKDELTALQQFLDDKINFNILNEPLESALLKIGLYVPTSNRGGTGKKIENIIKNKIIDA